jgi:4-hydroxybenzoate polyprenyltransferase
VRQVRAALRLMRPYSTGLAVLSILVPVFARTKDLSLSLQMAVPFLFGGMLTYILNDLDDLDKDRVNHPDRPLPRGDVTPTFVVVLYYICLALALLTTRSYVPQLETAFLYYAGFAACISYRYVVEYLPLLKAAYVAATTTVPLLVLMTLFPADAGDIKVVTTALFLSIFGRELCKDIPDRRGDPVSVLHRIDPLYVARFGFAIQGFGVAILFWLVRDMRAGICAVLMISVLVASYTYWFQLHRAGVALALMKFVALLGLYFLL